MFDCLSGFKEMEAIGDEPACGTSAQDCLLSAQPDLRVAFAVCLWIMRKRRFLLLICFFYCCIESRDLIMKKLYERCLVLPFVSGICIAAAAGQSLDRSQRVEANDVLLRAVADVLQTFVRDGHGSAIRDVAEKDIDPREVQDLHQGLALWGLEGANSLTELLGPQFPGEIPHELEMLLRMLMPNSVDCAFGRVVLD